MAKSEELILGNTKDTGVRPAYDLATRERFAAEDARRDALTPEEREKEDFDKKALGALASDRKFTDYDAYQPDSSKEGYNPYPVPPEIVQQRIDASVAAGLLPEGFKRGDPQPNHKSPFYNPYDRTKGDADRTREERAALVARGIEIETARQDAASASVE